MRKQMFFILFIETSPRSLLERGFFLSGFSLNTSLMNLSIHHYKDIFLPLH